MVSFEVSFRDRGFCLRRLAQSSVCDDSTARNGCRGILGRFTGCPCTFCDRSHCFENVTAVTASRRIPQSPLQKSYRSHCFENVTVGYGRHRFKNVTGGTASRMLRPSPLQNMLPQSPFRECDRSHRFKNSTAVTASRNVTAVTVLRM